MNTPRTGRAGEAHADSTQHSAAAPHVRAAVWLQEHPNAGNAIIVTALAPLPLLIATVTGTHLTAALILLLPLYLRSSRPAQAACLFAALVILSILLLRIWPFTIGVWGAPWLMHTVAARCERPVRRGVLLLALATCALSGALWPRWWLNPSLTGTGEYTPGTGEWLVGAVVLTLLTSLVMIAAHLAGDLRRATLERRQAELERAEALAQRARQLEIERDQEIRLAAQDERTRIAREMHDVVAHSLSVVIAQADGARYAVASDPTVAAEVLGTIATTARSSLGEMRSLLGVLRTDEETERSPVPTVQDLPDLIGSVRQTGLDIDLRVSPEPMPELAPGPSLAIYRLVQEGLTNTLKHSPQATSVRVELAHDRSDLVVRVTGDGHRPSSTSDSTPAESGQGLRGLRERFGLYGGEVEAGPDPSAAGHWTLAGWLPVDGSAPSPPAVRLDTESRGPAGTADSSDRRTAGRLDARGPAPARPSASDDRPSADDRSQERSR